jgi:hypothetical protein
MFLSKWYCDCVTDAGAAFIGYWARLRVGPVTIPYAATLHKPVGQATAEQTRLLPTEAPAVKNGDLRWDCRRLGVRVAWNARARAIHRTLLECAHGSIIWHCHVPAGRARVDFRDAAPLEGLGYAEHLTMSLKPWELPFHEVRWGRFLSHADALIWIELRGADSRPWVFHNGVEIPDAVIDPEGVQLPFDHGWLQLSGGAPLRDGPLLSTALRAFPAKRLWLSGRLEGAHETKWVARGRFTAGGRHSTGWAIHEVVRLR